MQVYYIMRKDLNMSPAKLAVQVGHGTCRVAQCLNAALFWDWCNNKEMKKIVVEIDSEEKLCNIANRFISEMERMEKYSRLTICENIYDNGYTEFNNQKTLTGIVIFAKEYPNYIKRLRLYK